MRAADMRDRGLKYQPGSADEVLGRVLAGRHGLRVRAEEQYEIAAAMRMAAEFGFRFVLEGGDESWRLAEELGKAGFPVVLGPIRAPESAGGGGRFRRSQPKTRDATAAILAQAKVPLALSAGDQDGEYGLARQGTHARRHGLGLKETLAAVTSRPADLLGLGKRIGRVAVGFDADILLWTGEPFAATSAIDMVMIDGARVRGRSF
jgi:imidazolonepropionase-like amidohydrolase